MVERKWLEDSEMNMLDMDTREQVNKIHIAEMHQQARSRYSWRALNPSRITAIRKERVGLVLVLAILILVMGSFLLSAAANS